MTNLETILEKILTKLDKIIENQEKQSIKPSSNLSDLLLETTNVFGKEYTPLPTPWNDKSTPTCEGDILYRA